MVTENLEPGSWNGWNYYAQGILAWKECFPRQNVPCPIDATKIYLSDA